MKKTLSHLVLTLIIALIGSKSLAQPSSPEVLENALGAVVTVGVFDTDPAKKTLGFRGEPSEMAYAKMLDLSGASGSGSGFFIKYNNKPYVITNAHVIEQASDAKGAISVFTINRTKYTAKLVGGDSFYDIAVLALDTDPGKEVTYLNFRKADAKIGERVYAIGNPLGEYPYSVSDGIISAKNRVRGGLTGKFGFLQTTATVIWGNSGGPLVDVDGNVLGINSQIAFANQGGTAIWQPQINFALEANLALRLVSDILNNDGIVKRGFLGIELSQKKLSYQPGTREYQYYAKVYTTDECPVISKVAENAPASGLAPYVGYQITNVNNNATRNLEEVLGELEKAEPGQQLTLTLKKGAEQKVVSITPLALNGGYSGMIGKLFLQQAGLTYTQNQDKVYVKFSPSANTMSEMISTIQNKQVSAGNLANTEWQILGIGIMAENNESLWRVNNVADVGTAARLTGLSGMVDIILFKKGGDPESEESYIKKRMVLSNDVKLVKQTLWY